MSKYQKGFTLIEILLVSSIMGLLAALIISSLMPARDRARVTFVKNTLDGIHTQIELASMEGKGILAPLDPYLGGGPICSTCPMETYGSWPSLAKAGYIYNVTSTPDISKGSYSFSITKPDKPTIQVDFYDGNGSIAVIETEIGTGGTGESGGSGAITRSLTGNIRYTNVSNSQMHNVTVTLKQGGFTKYTATTPTTGAGDYNFSAIDQGVYDVYLNKPEAVDWGINATDAAVTNAIVTNPATNRGYLVYLAADVYDNSPSTIITVDDANLIQAHFVYDTPFSMGAWVFAKRESEGTPHTSYPIPYANSGGFSNMTITISDSDIVQNFSAVAYGDANRSYTPL